MDDAGLRWQAGGVWVGLPEQELKDFGSTIPATDIHREAQELVEELLRAQN
jgi:hypothetical protein